MAPDEFELAVVHVRNVDVSLVSRLGAILGEVCRERRIQQVISLTDSTMLKSATYKFDVVEDATFFAGKLGEAGIPYSILPRSSYVALTTAGRSKQGQLQ